jgi:hypothetical protein
MGRDGVSGKAVVGRGLHGELAAIYLRERAASRHSHGGGQRGIRQSAAALLERDSRETCRMQWSTVDGRWSMVNGQWSMVNGQRTTCQNAYLVKARCSDAVQ